MLDAGPVKRRTAVATMLGVDVSSVTQKATDLWHVVLFHRLEQFLVSTIHSFCRRWTAGSIYKRSAPRGLILDDFILCLVYRTRTIVLEEVSPAFVLVFSQLNEFF
jgi:hypothetical protein